MTSPRRSPQFAEASIFNGNIGDWDMSSAENLYGMFVGAAAFNNDLSGWDMSVMHPNPLAGTANMVRASTQPRRLLPPSALNAPASTLHHPPPARLQFAANYGVSPCGVEMSMECKNVPTFPTPRWGVHAGPEWHIDLTYIGGAYDMRNAVYNHLGGGGYQHGGKACGEESIEQAEKRSPELFSCPAPRDICEVAAGGGEPTEAECDKYAATFGCGALIGDICP